MNFENKAILVTGGTGSMGQTLVRRLLQGEHGLPSRVVVMSRDEGKQHDMRLAFLRRAVATDEIIYRNHPERLQFRIGDVRAYEDVCAALRDIDIVINAAALKQVPTCEYFPDQAILTNCLGAVNIVRAIQDNRTSVKDVVAISTDKACKPVNVMGMTKALQERIFISANTACPDTRFVGVRYGNVLASRGSVIPLFHDQIRSRGTVTVTVPEMTRFLLSLDQAVDTVFAALDGAAPGEIYVPRAPAATVVNIARALIGDRPVEIETIGIRPGEKLHEIMVSDEEAPNCEERGNFYAIRPLLPELSIGHTASGNSLDKEYSSSDHVLSLDETAALLKRHRLMIEDVATEDVPELLR